MDSGREDDVRKDWNAPAVVAMIDGIVRRGSQLVRRGRWLQILSNASLCWETADRGPHAERSLYIRKGRIHPGLQGTVGEEAMAFSSSPAALPRVARAVFTSAAAYDRMRVLTTELRRLTGEGRRVRICPAVGGPVERRGLVRLLSLI